MMNNSIKFWFGGGQVLCTTNTSSPRTFSSIFTKVSPLGKSRIIALAKGTLMLLQMASAKVRLDLPENIFTVVQTGYVVCNTWVPPLSNGLA